MQKFGVLIGEVRDRIKATADELGLAPELEDEKSLSDLLLEQVLATAEVFVDQEREPHLTLRESPRMTLVIRSKAVRGWLACLCYKRLGRAVGDATLGSVVSTLAGIATHGGGG